MTCCLGLDVCVPAPPPTLPSRHKTEVSILDWRSKQNPSRGWLFKQVWISVIHFFSFHQCHVWWKTQQPSIDRLIFQLSTIISKHFFQLPSMPHLKEGPMKVNFLSKLDSLNCFQVPNLQYLEEDQRNQQVQLAAKNKLRKWLKKSGWSFFWIRQHCHLNI